MELSKHGIHALVSRLSERMVSASEGGKHKRDLTAVESSLSREIDAYRDLLKAGFPSRASTSLQALLDKLPEGATPYIRFRIKANVGYCLLHLSDNEGALTWLDDAVDSAPTEPKAVATQAFALMVRKDFAGAVRLAKEGLAKDPTNEDLAGHLIEASTHLEGAADPEPLVPVHLLDRERVLIARCLLHRQRENRPAWWRLARHGAKRFPENEMLRLFEAEGVIDEIARATRNEIQRPLTEAERASLRRTAFELEAIWRRIKGSEVPEREDGLAALSTCMVAYRLLEDGPKAVAMAADLVYRSDFEPALIIAVQVALAFDDVAVADVGLAKLPDTGEAGFIKGMAEINRGDKARAVEILAKAEIPAQERLFVDSMIALLPLEDVVSPGDEAILERVRVASVAEPRTLVVVARMAKRRNLVDLAKFAYEEALNRIGPEMSYPARLMVASYAYDLGDYGTIIRTLHDNIDCGAWTKELQWLSDAHASETPSRQRNLRFYDKLPKTVRKLSTIASGHASVLLDFGRVAEAETILRKVVVDAPSNPFARLKLIEALRRQDRTDDVAQVVIDVDEKALVGPVTLRLMLAHALREFGEAHRALLYAYDLLRSAPNQPRIALGYVGLVLGGGGSIIPPIGSIGDGCWVSLESASGELDAFVIDNGTSFLGVDVVPVEHDRARRVVGLRVGDHFEAVGLGDRSQTWTIKEVKSKFLHVFHVIMDEFERRFPATNGLWRFTLKDDDVQPMLDLIREQAEARRDNVRRLYIEGNLPLAIVARTMGSDAASFAQYLRFLGFDILTCGGSIEERDQGLSNARDYRNAGAVMDTYTAVVAAEIEALGPLRDWFGTLAIARSTIDEIDGQIAQSNAGLGRLAMTVAFDKGQFVRQDITDDMLSRQIDALHVLKARLLSHCEVVAVALPDDVIEEVARFTRETGREAMDPMFLAGARGDVLLSDDLPYRRIAEGLTKVDGTWLQVVFAAVHANGGIRDTDMTRLCVYLAARRHGTLMLDFPLLKLLFEHCSPEEFDVVCHFLGGANADMRSHSHLAASVIQWLWSQKDPEPKRERGTSAILRALLRQRNSDWTVWLAFIWLGAQGNQPLRSFLVRWMHGHFLPTKVVGVAVNVWIAAARSVSRRRVIHASEGVRIAENIELTSVQLSTPRLQRVIARPAELPAVAQQSTPRAPSKRSARRRRRA